LIAKQKRKPWKKHLDFDPSACIDLHIHSTASDGTLTPPEILELANDLKLAAISITDHDTLDGSRQAIARGIPDTLGFLTGVEISARRPSFFPGKGSCHILGYRIDLENRALNKALQKLQTARKDRNPKILERLRDLGITLSMEEVKKAAGPKGQIGRPHIAQVMLDKEYVPTFSAAFDNYLAAEKPAYVDKYRVDCLRAIDLIRDAGGIPVLAHPVLLGTPGGRLDDAVIKSLKEMGLIGIEALYPGHSTAQQKHYLNLAGRHGLIVTGGTDFHGKFKPQIQLGSGKGDLCVPIELFHTLSNHA
jgi:predicted metal-dependent phosphoesterase TrpH